MPTDVRLTVRERLTLAAALRFWRDEMVPSPELQRFYFEDPFPDPLTAAEVDALLARLAAPTDQ